VWARTNNAHVAKDDIEKLWSFINMREAEELTDLSDALIIDGNLLSVGIVVYEIVRNLKQLNSTPI